MILTSSFVNLIFFYSCFVARADWLIQVGIVDTFQLFNIWSHFIIPALVIVVINSALLFCSHFVFSFRYFNICLTSRA